MTDSKAEGFLNIDTALDDQKDKEQLSTQSEDESDNVGTLI